MKQFRETVKTLMGILFVAALLSSCDLRQRFPINYVYPNFSQFKVGIENIKFNDRDDNGYFIYAFEIDEAQVDSKFSFYGQNYGSLQQLSTPEHPLLETKPHIWQSVYYPSNDTEIKIYPNYVSFSDIDFGEVTIVFGSDGYYRIYHDQIKVMGIEGPDLAVTSFFDQYKQALSLIRVGVNHWYDSD